MQLFAAAAHTIFLPRHVVCCTLLLQGQASDLLVSAAGAGAAPDVAAAFTKYDQFCKRCKKLTEMFTTVHQFTELGQHTHIEGIQSIMTKFDEVRGR